MEGNGQSKMGNPNLCVAVLSECDRQRCSEARRDAAAATCDRACAHAKRTYGTASTTCTVYNVHSCTDVRVSPP